MSAPASVKVTCGVLRQTIRDNDFVLAYFGDESDPLFAAHSAYGNTEHRASFVHNDQGDCADEYKPGFRGSIFFRKFEQKAVLYQGQPDSEELSEWARLLMIPSVFEFDDAAIDSVFR